MLYLFRHLKVNQRSNENYHDYTRMYSTLFTARGL